MSLRSKLEFTIKAYQAQADSYEKLLQITTNPEDKERVRQAADMLHEFISDMQHILDTTEGEQP